MKTVLSAAALAMVCACGTGGSATPWDGGAGGGEAGAGGAGGSASGQGGGGSGVGGGAGADGGSVTELLLNTDTAVSSLVCDTAGLYWTEPTRNVVMSSELDGTNPHEVGLVTSFAVAQIFVAGTSLYMAVDNSDKRVVRQPKAGGAPLVLARTPDISAMFVAYDGEVYWGDNGHVMSRNGLKIDDAGLVRDIWGDSTGIYWSSSSGKISRTNLDGKERTVIGLAQTHGSGMGLVRALGATIAAGPSGISLIPDNGEDQTTIGTWSHSVSYASDRVLWVGGSPEALTRTLYSVVDSWGRSDDIATMQSIEAGVSCGGWVFWWTANGQILRRKLLE